MNSRILRDKFIKFFEGKGHAVIPSSSLVPENDPTVLFTTAGMHPLVPYLLGEKHPSGKRLVDVQKCIRTDDIDEVGDKVHHTFFEMLGFWSLGDYFKKEAIEWSFELLTGEKYLNISIDKLAVSVFAGDNDAPFDEESNKIWLSLGIKPERIAKLPKKDNWWGPAGEVGPCGPDTEMFVWTGNGEAPDNFQETCKHPEWVEIWNDVFMQYNKVRIKNHELGIKDQFGFEKLAQHNVDTGMGLERMLAIQDGFDDNYKTDLFWPIIEEIEKVSGKKYNGLSSVISSDLPADAKAQLLQTGVERSFRVIADHLKAAVFAIGDGVIPSNKDRGYVVRRLIRRAIVKAHQLGVSDNFTTKIAKKVFEIYEGVYFDGHPERQRRISGNSSEDPQNDKEMTILEELEKEETKFRKTLVKGLEVLRMSQLVQSNPLDIGKTIFNLFQSHGFPIELSLEQINKKNEFNSRELNTIKNEAYRLYAEHQELSRTASAGKFKGGLSEAGEITTKYHTATHLLLAALRQVLGDHVFQKGSNITAERMRFDFSHPEKMTTEQVKEVEDIVNEKIKENLPVDLEEMGLEDAKNCGAMGVFESKYGERVKVYSIGLAHSTPDGRSGSREFFSREMCGGPHVAGTGILGHFKIIKEEASSSGVRRIKAILE